MSHQSGITGKQSETCFCSTMNVFDYVLNVWSIPMRSRQLNLVSKELHDAFAEANRSGDVRYIIAKLDGGKCIDVDQQIFVVRLSKRKRLPQSAPKIFVDHFAESVAYVGSQLFLHQLSLNYSL